MFQQSSSRNGRAKGSRVKRVLQLAVLLVIVVWLLHYINKKEEHNEIYESNFSKEGEGLDFGRKGKAGSENVIVIDGEKGNLDVASETDEDGDKNDEFSKQTEDGASETNENGDKTDVLNEQNEENNVEEAQVSNGIVENIDQTEVKPQELDDKGDATDSNTQTGEAVTDGVSSQAREDVLELPSEREHGGSSDRIYEEKETNTEQEEVDEAKESNEIVQNNDQTVEPTNDNAEATNSDEKSILGSNNQQEVSETNSVGEEVTHQPEHENSNESKLENAEHVEQPLNIEGNSVGENVIDQSEHESSNENKIENDEQVEQPLNTEGTDDVSTSNESHEMVEHVEQHFSTEGTGDDSTNETHRELSSDRGATDHQVIEIEHSGTSEENSIGHSTSTEQTGDVMSTNEEASKGDEVTFQNEQKPKDEAKLDVVSTEATSMESRDEVDKSLDENNEELSTINENLERDAVERHEDSSSHLEVTNNSQTEKENVDLEPKTEGSTPQEENASEAESNGDSNVNTETNSANNFANPSHDGEDNKSAILTNENPDTNAVEIENIRTSEGENQNNVASDETNTEQTSNETTGITQENNIVVSTGNENNVVESE